MTTRSTKFTLSCNPEHPHQIQFKNDRFIFFSYQTSNPGSPHLAQTVQIVRQPRSTLLNRLIQSIYKFVSVTILLSRIFRKLLGNYPFVALTKRFMLRRNTIKHCEETKKTFLRRELIFLSVAGSCINYLTMRFILILSYITYSQATDYYCSIHKRLQLINIHIYLKRYEINSFHH